MRISDWSSDVCSSDLFASLWSTEVDELRDQTRVETIYLVTGLLLPVWGKLPGDHVQVWRLTTEDGQSLLGRLVPAPLVPKIATAFGVDAAITITPAEAVAHVRSEEHTSELQSLMRISYTVFC